MIFSSLFFGLGFRRNAGDVPVCCWFSFLCENRQQERFPQLQIFGKDENADEKSCFFFLNRDFTPSTKHVGEHPSCRVLHIIFKIHGFPQLYNYAFAL